MPVKILVSALLLLAAALPAAAQCIESEEKAEKKPQPVASADGPLPPRSATFGG